MRKQFVVFSTVFLSFAANAQDETAVKKEVRKEIADKFAVARVFDVQYQQYLPSDYDAKLFGREYESGEIQNRMKLRVAANIPFLRKPRWTLTSSFNYKYESFELADVANRQDASIPVYSKTMDFHYLSAAVSFTYFARLFKKPFIYNFSVIADGTEKDVQRLKGLFAATLVLKKTERTTMTAGIIGLLDPASVVPVLPVFTLEHRFENSPWTFDFILPQRLFFKRPLFENGRLSLGTELASEGFYVALNQPGLARVYDFRQLELRSGITYEHKLHKSVIATFKGGIANVFNSRLTERGKSTNDYIYNTTQDGTGYFSVGVSFNPFK